MDQVVLAVGRSVVRLAVRALAVLLALGLLVTYAANDDKDPALALALGAGTVTFALLALGIWAVARRN